MGNLPHRYSTLQFFMNNLTSENMDWVENNKEKKSKWSQIKLQLKLSEDDLSDFVSNLKKFRRNRIAYEVLQREADVKMDKFGNEEKLKLIEIWDHFNPFNKFSDVQRTDYKGTHWIDMGFQGEQPETDFRGAGRLGLHIFHDFVKNYYAQALTCLSTSQSEGTQYFLACTSINFTFMMLNHIKVISKKIPSFANFFLEF